MEGIRIREVEVRVSADLFIIFIIISQQYLEMGERRLWLSEEDDVIKKLARENEKRDQQNKWTWTQIANHLNNKMPESKRTGKQCRQRWFNQLHPSIKDEEWSQQQIKNLFQFQNEFGNKWAQIAKQLPGRTDNNVKNYFYSSLRRAIRRLNNYVSEFKKRSNIKPFKSTLLTKILSISDEKHRNRLNIKNSKAIEIAVEIKNKLAELSQEGDEEDELSEEDKIFREELVEQIQEFNRNCKRKKGKKVQSNQMIEEEEQEENSEVHQKISEEPSKVSRPKRNKEKDNAGKNFSSSSEMLKNLTASTDYMKLRQNKRPPPIDTAEILFGKKPSKVASSPHEVSKSRFLRKDSNKSQNNWENSLFMDFTINNNFEKVMKGDSKIFEAAQPTPTMRKKESFRLIEDQSPYFRFGLESREYYRKNPLGNMESMDIGRLLRGDSKKSC